MKTFHEKKYDMELACSLDNNGVIRIKMAGNVSSDYEDEFMEWSETVREVMHTAKETDPKKVFCVIDLTGQKIDADKESLGWLIDLVKYNKDYVTRTGVYGANLITRSLVDIALRTTGRDNMKMFETQEQAEGWVFTGEEKG
ncbi:MAG: hypothetical protein LR008_00150 [Candidatus Pacebacteria bacterium]|nr:hypothetical protein [Candidatus Paceibacterota bacterium]